jgi:uncharacterized LabA/DUF88 family protein
MAQDKKDKNERVNVYIDGFNLYFGMREAGFDNCRWLNVRKLIQSFILPHQELCEIKYFTSRVSNNPDKQKRQATYLEAMATSNVRIVYGHYQDVKLDCSRCGHAWRTAKEKMTDVNIATSMIVDAFQDKFDTAILVSGDSDLVPPIKAVHEYFKPKKVTIFFPPKRHNTTVASAAKGSLIIGRK